MKLKTENVKPLLIGLAGGIASGKTAVLKQFAELGAITASCDEISKKIYLRKKSKVFKIFSTLDRKEIAGIIFRNKAKKKELEELLHPEIIKELKQLIKRYRNLTTRLPKFSSDSARVCPPKHGCLGSAKPPANEASALRRRIVIIETPLLFEAGLEPLFDKSIVVYCSKPTQLRRLMLRDGISKQDAAARIDAQMPLKIKKGLADYTIYNSGALSQTANAVKELLKKKLEKA